MDALETIGGLLALLFFLGCGYAAWEMFRSVVKPKPENHLRWYDRGLRAIGGLIFLAIYIYFVVAMER